MSDMPDYDAILECVKLLGISRTFSDEALLNLTRHPYRDETLTYDLLTLLGSSAFTDEAMTYFESRQG